MKRAFKPHLTVAAVVVHGGRFLCVEERIDGALVINQPAGHVEDGESVLAAVERETLEETGWTFVADALLGVYRWRNPANGETFVRVAFRGALGEQLHERPTDAVILATHWLAPDALRGGGHQPRSPLVLRCMDDWLAGQRYPLDLLIDL